MKNQFFDTHNMSRHQKQKMPNSQPQALEKALQTLDASIEASKAARELQANVTKLPETYKKQKQKNSSLFNLYNMFASNGRSQEINFITSVAQSLDLPLDLLKVSCPIEIRAIRAASLQLDTLTANIPDIIQGARICVLEEIESSYKMTLWSPKASALYSLLTKQVGTISTEDKVRCLTKLQHHLKTTPKEKIDCGNKNAETVLAKISTQIEALTSSASALRH